MGYSRLGMLAFQLEPGTVFASDFRIVEPLSEGGMGAVYVAEQISTRARRALKLMHPQLVRDPGLRARFEQEAKVSAQIPSDHVVQVIAAGVDTDSGMPWLAMELLDGTDLVEAAATGRCGAAVLREIMEQLCHGLGAAHERGIVHRDLKPENVFLAAPRRPGVPFTVKILDFGIAKVTEQARSGAATAALGTPLWMAPEQAGATAGKISPATDIWALGLIAFWLLTGRSYWKGAQQDDTTLQALMREVLFDELPPASVRAAELGVRSSLPAGLDAWFARTVNRDPAQRYPDARVAFEALSHALTSPPVSGNDFADASTEAGRPSTPKTVDDVPPLQLPTAPAVTERQSYEAQQPQYPTPAVPYAAYPQQPTTGGFGYATTSAPRRRLVPWSIATFIVVAAGSAAALFITYEDWRPMLEGLLRSEPATPGPAPAPAPAPEIVCPSGTRKSGDRCVKIVDRTCPSGMRFKTGTGCVAIVADAGRRPLLFDQLYGKLTFECSPGCDTVTINGKSYGASPVINVAVPTGTNVIIGRRKGYITYQYTLNVKAGTSYSRSIILKPLYDSKSSTSEGKKKK